jgi:hypothetical protein
MRTSRILIAGLLLVQWSATLAASGSGEVSLDRTAVQELFSAVLPRTESIVLGGLVEFDLTLQEIGDLRFGDGWIEGRLEICIDPPAACGAVRVRYHPEVEPITGTLRLVARTARPVAPLRFDFDLAPRLPPIDLPRRLDWELPMEHGAAVQLTCFVQGLSIDEDRIRLELSILPRRE